MIRRMLNSIRHLHPVSSFDSYFSSVQLHGGAVGPTIEEARKDYRKTISTENAGYFK